MARRLANQPKGERVHGSPYAWVGDVLRREISRMSRTDPSLCVWLDRLVEQGIRMSRLVKCEHKRFRGGSGQRGDYGWTYVIDAPGTGLAKIGYCATGALARRLRDLQSGSPVRLELVALANGGTQLEALWHQEHREHRRHLEWFDSSVIVPVFAEAMRSAPADGCARCVLLADRISGIRR
jgi:hypothetical protein